MRLTFLIGVALGAIGGVAQTAVYDLEPPGPSESRVDLVILAEGYTVSQEAKFVSDATRVVEGFFEVEPYREYAALFNVRAIYVASAQSGSDHPLSGVFRNTYFNSSYDTSGFSQVLTIPPNDRDPRYENGMGRIDQLVAAHAPQADLIVLLVNDIVFGGSGGSVLISSLSSASVDLLLHESGHTLGLLADEYTDPYPLAPREMPNATAKTKREEIPWRAWIADDTPVPTPATAAYAARVGLFEGAQYQAKGWYRPRQDCQMRTVGAPFCEVCREQIIRRLYQFARPAGQPQPVSTNIEAPDGVETVFEVTAVQPRTHAVDIRWFVDAQLDPSAFGERFVLDGRTLSSGMHSVTCEAVDRTDWVRTDPEQRLEATFTWQVHVTHPRLEFGVPVLDAWGRLRVSVTGVAPSGFVVVGSADLRTWTPVLTNGLPEGEAIALSFFHGGGLAQGARDVPMAAARYGLELVHFERWGFLWLLAAFLAPWWMRKERKAAGLFLSLMVLVHIAAVAFSPLEIRFQAESTIFRLPGQLAPLAAACAGCGFALFMDRGKA